MRNPFALGAAAVALLFGLVTVFDSFYTVAPTERGVVVTLGKVVGVAEPGVNIKAPFITQVPTIETRDRLLSVTDLSAYTRDQQVATIPRVSVTYRVNPEAAQEIYLRYGSVDNMIEQLVTRRIGAALEEVFGRYNAERAVQERTQLGRDFAALIQDVEGPFTISQIIVENFDLPDEYEKNINDRMAAEVAATTAEQTARATVTAAQANADASLAQARATAEAARLQGEAEADAIRARAAALGENPNLIALVQAERWDGVLPSTMVPNGAVPFVDVNAATGGRVSAAAQ